MSTSDRQVEGVTVEIFGEQYRIGGDPKQVQQVAEYVDKKMEEVVGSQKGRMPKTQVAMLAAMEITAELFRVMSERKAFTDRAHESIERLTQLVEDRGRITNEAIADADADAHLEQRISERQEIVVSDRVRERQQVSSTTIS
jgi:cell division protein ZapA (FtsZ GTPase activity inhibitor)